jgi:hypothetical protein
MGQLVPEQRTDKNGKIVTRHVSDSSGALSGKQKRIPVPSAGPNPKHAAREAMARLKTNDIDIMRSGYQNSVLYYLASVSPDLIESVVSSAVASTKDEAKVWLYYLGELPGPPKRSPQWDVLWRKYQNLAQRIPTATYLEETSPHSRYRNQTVNLLSLVDQAYPEKHDDPEFMRAASIVLHINGENEPFRMLSKTGNYKAYFTDIEYIAEHIDEVEKVIPILRQRKSTSMGVVAALLESGSTSLADGML